MLESLAKLYDRDLQKLRNEIDVYENEADLWIIKSEINNSAGNLCLHLIGNLNHYIGHQLGETDYVRNRPLEFSDKNVPKAINLWKIAADNGHCASQYTLGHCYLIGKWVSKDIRMARYYLSMSAKQGDAYAIAYLRSLK